VKRGLNIIYYDVIIDIIFFLLGYFLYGSLNAALAVLLLALLLDLFNLISIIPFVGAFIYFFVAKWLQSQILALTGLTPTWLTSLIFAVSVAISIIVTFLCTLGVLSLRE